MATSLVTGGAGFLGSHLVDCLLSRGDAVVVLDDLSGGFRDQVPPGAELVVGSVLDRNLLTRLFEGHRFELVYHLAAYAAEGLSHYVRRFNYENNLIGSVELVNHAVRYGVRRFVFTSSIAVYGRQAPPLDEELPPRPEDPYGVAKYAIELDLAAAQQLFDLDYVILRPHNVYGERQNLGDRYRNVLGIFLRQILLGEPVTVFGDGSQTRAFTHVADVAPVIACAAHLPSARNQIFNLGADQPYSINELIEIVGRAFGLKPEVRHLPPRHEIPHVWAAHGKARRLLGAEARISLEEGVQRMVSWARRVGVRHSGPFAALEIERGLPSIWRDPG